MICPSCDGKKAIIFPTALAYMREHGKPATLPCPDCGATGEVDDRHIQWKVAGEALKDARLAGRETLRAFCKRMGVDPALRSRQERGFAEHTDPYGCRGWQNRTSDAFTQWKDEYGHRGMCQAPNGAVCPCCDSDEVLASHQSSIKREAAAARRRTDECDRMLSAHVAKWGVK